MPDTPVFQTFGERLRYWRERRGYTNQGQFAAKIGIKQPSLSLLESSRSTTPAADTLMRAADLLQLEPRYLLYGKGPAQRMAFGDLSVTERYLILMYRALDEEARSDIESALNEAYNRLNPGPNLANPYPATGLPPMIFEPVKKSRRTKQ